MIAFRFDALSSASMALLRSIELPSPVPAPSTAPSRLPPEIFTALAAASFCSSGDLPATNAARPAGVSCPNAKLVSLEVPLEERFFFFYLSR